MNHTDPRFVYIAGFITIVSGLVGMFNPFITIVVGLIVMFVGVAVSGVESDVQ